MTCFLACLNGSVVWILDSTIFPYKCWGFFILKRAIILFLEYIGMFRESESYPFNDRKFPFFVFPKQNCEKNLTLA